MKPIEAKIKSSRSGQSRRFFLWNQGGGFAGLALAWILQQDRALGADSPLTPKNPHFPAKAKRVLQVFAVGGVSHLDTFDFKPDLIRFDGKPYTGGKIETFFGKPGNLMKNAFEFRRRGESGLWVSELFPSLAKCADDLTFIHSMTGKSPEHATAQFLMNTGFLLNGFPSMGAWVSYGLGTVNQDLPAFVVLPDPRAVPPGGAINWTSGFLPAAHQGTEFSNPERGIPDLATPSDISPSRRSAALKWLAEMNKSHMEENPGDSTLDARIRSYELAARMQMSVPGVLTTSGETESTHKLYGLDRPECAAFGKNCLVARRLLEKGVRFVQLFHGGALGAKPRHDWDAHEDVIDNHTRQAQSLDIPLAGLLTDLKGRGLLDDTLILWCTEFGRTPFTQGLGRGGRDHHEHVFTVWMAGAGLKKGFAYGKSDELGYKPVENPVTVHDYHATAMHLLGIDHEKLTYYHNGVQRRLTDVHGHVIEDLLA